jgi:hypothetical protein
MKTKPEEWEKIHELDEAVKNLDPILKARIIDYELAELFKEDYLHVLNSLQSSPRIQSTQHPVNEIGGEKEGGNSDERQPTLREFFQQKKPVTALENVAVFGFYLERYRGMYEFSEKEIAEAYYEARSPKPKVIGQALRDARNAKGYLVEGSKRGRFRLSNLGENLVVHDLPKKSGQE